MKKESITKLDRNKCSGCGLCSVKCPQNCIEICEDREGFRFPNVNEIKCIQCGICLQNCPATDAATSLYSKAERKYFCGIIQDEELLIKSSSGGIFGALALLVLEKGGYVCGCVFNEDMEAVHLLSSQEADVERMYGSKYVQSRAEHCFLEVKEHLQENDTVLFTGTACQIAALRLYLGKEYSNLYCVEILCHGVPSPNLFRQYKRYMETRLQGRIIDIHFRDKRKDGWGSEHRTCIIYHKNGKLCEYRPKLPAYFSAFFYGLNLREACYQCKFATSERVADLTIGDFWGAWKKYGKRFREGISVVGINSEKGMTLVDSIKGQFSHYELLTESEAIISNDNFTHPIQRPRERDSFYQGTIGKGYRGLWRKVYFAKTYRVKVLKSFYGAFVPENIRVWMHKFGRKKSGSKNGQSNI